MAAPFIGRSVDAFATLSHSNIVPSALALSARSDVCSLRFNAVGAATDFALTQVETARTAGAFGFIRQASVWTSGTTLCEALNSSGVAVLRIQITATNAFTLQYWTGAVWTDVGAAITAALTAINYRFSVEFTGMGGASGSLSFKVVSDLSEIVLGSATASGLTLTSATNVAQTKHYATSTVSGHYLADVFIKDGTGHATYAYCNLPNAAGTDNTDGTGTFASIDDTASTYDADFISLPTSTNKRSVKSAARSLGGRTTKGVGFAARLRCGASGPTQVKPYLLIGATRYYHAAAPVTLTTTFTGYVFIWELDPSTAAAWAATNASSANTEYGIEVV